MKRHSLGFKINDIMKKMKWFASLEVGQLALGKNITIHFGEVIITKQGSNTMDRNQGRRMTAEENLGVVRRDNHFRFDGTWYLDIICGKLVHLIYGGEI